MTECNCVKEIQAILESWKTTVDTDEKLLRAFTLAQVMASPYLIDVEACRLYKKEFLHPIMNWIVENGGKVG